MAVSSDFIFSSEEHDSRLFWHLHFQATFLNLRDSSCSEQYFIFPEGLLRDQGQLVHILTRKQLKCMTFMKMIYHAIKLGWKSSKFIIAKEKQI